MDRLHNEIAELLAEHGRIPPADIDGLIEQVRAQGHGEAWFWAEVNAVAKNDSTLAAKRRLVIAIRNRAQLQGEEFDVDAEVERHRDAADALGWSRIRLRTLVEQLDREVNAPAVGDGSDANAGSVAPSGRSIRWIAALAVLALIVGGFAVWQWTAHSPSGPEVDAASGADVDGGSRAGAPGRDWRADIRRVVEDLRWAADFEDAVDAETRRLMDRFERGEPGAEAGPQLLAVFRRALRDAEPDVWAGVSRDPSPDSMRRFLDAFPDGEFATRAASRLDELREDEARSRLVGRVQQQLVRLGRDVTVTGELDESTLVHLADLQAGLGREGVARVTPELLDELQSLRAWPRRVGDVFTDCDGCPEMVVIGAGRFRMGSPAGESGSEPNERPVHDVAVPRFAMGRTEVTFDQWTVCVEDGGCDFVPPDEGWGRGRRPVVNVSWSDALGYLRWLSRRTGEDYRLPTEAEWEFAARAGTSTRFYTGRCLTSEQANFDGRRPAPGCPASPARRQTLPVASFPPNAFGLFDMSGNVREWTRDCWNDDYAGAPSDGSAWLTGDCSRPVLRGGSWRGTDRAVRSANRTRPSGAFNDARTGFRPARDLQPVSGSRSG